MDEIVKLIEAAQKGSIEDVKSIVQSHPELIHKYDETGASALHYAAFGGHRDVVRFLVQQGADINARDERFGATPAGWAIEYMREMGGFLGIELTDMAFAIHRGDIEWVARFLKRFPHLREAHDSLGNSFTQLAGQSGNKEIEKLFDSGQQISNAQ